MIIKTLISGKPVQGGTDAAPAAVLSKKIEIVETPDQVNSWYDRLVTQVSGLREAHSTLSIGVTVGEQPTDRDETKPDDKSAAVARVPNLIKALDGLSPNIRFGVEVTDSNAVLAAI